MWVLANSELMKLFWILEQRLKKKSILVFRCLCTKKRTVVISGVDRIKTSCITVATGIMLETTMLSVLLQFISLWEGDDKDNDH